MLFKINEVKTYTFQEFKEIQENRNIANRYTKDELRMVDKMIEHIKTNKVIYAKLVFITAIMLHSNINIYADTLESSLDSVGNQLIDMLASVAKWACIGIGIKNMAVTMLNGGNLKRATTEGLQYLLGYLFIQFYPQLFDLFGKITIK